MHHTSIAYKLTRYMAYICIISLRKWCFSCPVIINMLSYEWCIIYTHYTYQLWPCPKPKNSVLRRVLIAHPTAIYSDPPTTGGVLLLSTATPPVVELILVAVAVGAVVGVEDNLLISIYNFVFSRKDTVWVRVAIPVSVCSKRSERLWEFVYA